MRSPFLSHTPHRPRQGAPKRQATRPSAPLPWMEEEEEEREQLVTAPRWQVRSKGHCRATMGLVLLE